jgi:hypothetical protein
MTERPMWVPAALDAAIPSAARVYDYLLGGGHNFPADRKVAEKLLQAHPICGQIAGANRAFLRRAILHMVECGITQFLDLGSGIPTVGNVHEVAQQADSSCRVVYVDHDEVAVAHSELLLAGNENAAVVTADLCQPDMVLASRAVIDLLDFNRPIGLLMVGVLHFVPDSRNPGGSVVSYRDELPPGSQVAISHLTADFNPEGMATVADAMRHSRDPLYFRPYDEIVGLFTGLELVEPGVVGAAAWRPERGDGGNGPRDMYAGVGRKP